MTSVRDKAILSVLMHEGGFVNDPHDPGGATKFGVTLRDHAEDIGDRDHDGDIDAADVRVLSVDDAIEVYRRDYWTRIQGDKLPPDVAFFLLDTAVNVGVWRAKTMLQRACMVPVDGEIGPITLAAAQAPGVLQRLAEIRRAFYRALPTFTRYGRGWLRRVDETVAAAERITQGANA